MHEVGPLAGAQVRHLPAQECQGSPVVERDPLVRVQHPDADGRAIREIPETLFALPQFVLGAPALLEFQAQSLVGKPKLGCPLRDLLLQVGAKQAQLHVYVDPRQQFRSLKWFRYEVGGAQPEGMHPIFHLSGGAQKHHRNPAALLISP